MGQKREKTISTAKGTLFYEDREAGIAVAGYTGEDAALRIPERISDRSVISVAKKAFWNSSLRDITIPHTVTEIGDWAFAGCRKLEEVTLCGGEIRGGRGLFRKCPALRKISMPPPGRPEGARCVAPALLAAAVTILEAEYLLYLPQECGWYARFDARILEVLGESAEHVMKHLVYCAEEDMLDRQEQALYAQKKQKCRIALLRLLHREELSRDVEECLTAYLLRAAESGRCLWETVTAAGAEGFAYCDILLQTGCIHAGNINAILEMTGGERVESRASLLRRWQERERIPVWDTLHL